MSWFISLGLACPPATSGFTCRCHLLEPPSAPAHLISYPQTGRHLLALTHLIQDALASFGLLALPCPLSPAATRVDCLHLCFPWNHPLLLRCPLACGARGMGVGKGGGSVACSWAGPGSLSPYSGLGWSQPRLPLPSTVSYHTPPHLACCPNTSQWPGGWPPARLFGAAPASGAWDQSFCSPGMKPGEGGITGWRPDEGAVSPTGTGLHMPVIFSSIKVF